MFAAFRYWIADVRFLFVMPVMPAMPVMLVMHPWLGTWG